ncbi:MAG: peptidylprolyl isomerase [Bacteroidales bacterium]|nr:peptidylprolyl isomerase [Bacteroidales bacterium]
MHKNKTMQGLIKQALIILFVTFFTLHTASAQENNLATNCSFKDSILVRIDTTNYTVADFLWFYKKYSVYGLDDSATINSYLNKFIEYKTKVAEAEDLQLDSTRAFKNEFFKYLKITAHERMYEGEDKKLDEFVKMEYDRLHWDYEVAHIFIKSNKYDSPKDTAEIWNKVLQIKKELENGKSFETCVQEYSDDNLSKENNGNVGYITSMVSPYEYENVLYNANVGDIVTARTADGWYFIHVLNKRETKGAVDAAVILIYPKSEDSTEWHNARLTIDTVYNLLTDGYSFDSLSLIYNKNERLRETNGILGLIDNGMPYSKEIKETLFALENDGDFSKPIRLPYGYAIVKRRWIMPLPGFEAYRSGYEKRIAADKSRCTVINSFYENKMKNDLHYIMYGDELEKCMQYIDASILLGKWTKPKLDKDAVLFELGGESYGRNDFFDYLQVIQKNRLNDIHDKDMLVRIRFEDYVTRRLEFATMRNLEKKDADFQYTMQEYHDGMIVAELINQEVIQEAAKDSVGMRFYFNQHKENYMTEERTVYATIYIKNPKLHDKVLNMLYQQQHWYYGSKTKAKYANKMAYYESLGSPQLYILNIINAKTPNAIDVSIKEPLRLPNDVISEECSLIQKCIMPEKIADRGDSLDVTYYYLSQRQQTINEAKEQLLIDYQQETERIWLKSLMKRHTKSINEPIFNELIHLN